VETCADAAVATNVSAAATVNFFMAVWV
jgi:hypothetical protein